MIYNVCFLCGTDHSSPTVQCKLSEKRWKLPWATMSDAMSRVVGDGNTVVGDPTTFTSDDIDKGWDLESSGNMSMHNIVPGGVVVNKDISIDDYKKKTRSMSFQHDIIKKKINAIFSLFKDSRGFVHVFERLYDGHGLGLDVLPVERATNIHHVGAFKDFSNAKEYVEKV